MKTLKSRTAQIAILCVFLVLTVASVFLIPLTDVNYNLASYLPAESISKQGYDLYAEKFEGLNSAKVMVYLSEDKDAAYYMDKFNSIKEDSGGIVTDVTQNGSIGDTALYIFTFTKRGADPEMKDILADIRESAGENAAICGSVINDEATAGYMSDVSVTATAILVPVVIILVILTTRSYLSTVFVLLTLGVSIVMNLGTNFILGEVSYITQGIAIALQLAITLDYAIFMIHEYERQKESGKTPEDAVISAMKRTFSSVFAAALTTLSGFVALLFMRFSIGKDIGLVFIKGVFLSFLCVIFMLPALLLIFDRAIRRAEHKPFMPKFVRSAKGIFKARYVFVFLIFLLIPALILQNKNDYVFGSSGMISGEGVPSYEAKLEIDEVYGRQNQLIVLYKDRDPDAEFAVADELLKLKFDDGRPMFDSVLTSSAAKQMIVTAANTSINQMLPGITLEIGYADSYPELLTEIQRAAVSAGLPESIVEMFLQNSTEQLSQLEAAYKTIDDNFTSDGYSRMILTSDSFEEGDEAFAMYEAMLRVLDGNENFSGYLTVGETPSAYDIKDTMLSDYNWISAISAALVFLIILVTFRSVSIPILLMAPIYTGIYINAAIPALTGSSTVFLGMLVVSMIHLGATIDYAILYANKYMYYRKTSDKKEAFVKSLSESIGSILISAVALTVAGFAIGFSSSLPATRVMGMMIGRAGILSAFFTIFVLPGILYLCDPIIRKTTFRAGFLVPVSGADERGSAPCDSAAQCDSPSDHISESDAEAPVGDNSEPDADTGSAPGSEDGGTEK